MPRSRLQTTPLCLLLVAASAAAAAPYGQPALFAPAIAHGRDVLEKLVEAGEVPGVAVGVAAHGRVVWSEGFGLADLEHRVAATSRTRFGLGSISKTLTMAAALALVDEGLLDLDRPIEAYLPKFPHRGTGVTLRRLAVHQSGLSDRFAADHYLTGRRFASLDEAYREIVGAGADAAPGTEVAYATGLYTIIGRAMEVAAGQPYEEIVRRRVLEPAGMIATVPNERARIVADRTGFYIRGEDGGFANGPYYDPSFKLPGAGYLSTAEDLARFGAALLGPGLLSAPARAEMLRPVPLADGTATEFALGLRYAEVDGRRLLHQPGGGIGISSWLFLYPDEGLVVALLSNLPTGPVGGPTHTEIAGAFLEALAAEPAATAGRATKESP